MPETRPILVVEDSRRDLDLTLEALDRCGVRNPVEVARTGAEALARLSPPAGAPSAGRGPAFVLLDLKLPDIDGLEVLASLRRRSALSTTPVIVLTGSREPQDLSGAYVAGANAYVVKPLSFRSFVETMAGVVDFWLGWNHAPGRGSERPGFA